MRKKRNGYCFMDDITIKDVANLAEVSVGTVSMALNGKSEVNPKTRKKVLAIAEKLGYTPNRYAKVLSSKQTYTIGLIITDIINPFFGLIIDYVQQELENNGYDLILGISGGSRTKEQKIVKNFISHRVDGILMVPSHKQPADMRHFLELQRRNIPLCFITTYYAEIDASCVMTDLSAGSYKLTKHILQSGRKNIAYIVVNPSLPLSELRLEGYYSAFREAGIEVNPEWIISVGEASFECAYEAAGKIFGDGKKYDAVLTMNDIMALGVLKYLKEAGYKIPEDISIAGYDDLLYTTLLETPLTTVRQPIRTLCSRGVELLLKHIENPALIAEKVFLAPQLIIRDSTKK